jgi:hypothetical protein
MLKKTNSNIDNNTSLAQMQVQVQVQGQVQGNVINIANNINNIILEDGYNTDYIYCMVIALFYIPNDGMNKVINADTTNSNTYYIQEYIKSKFIYPIHRNLSIESIVVNKFRLFLYNCGWLKTSNKHILDRSSLDDFYNFLIADMMEYKLIVSQVNPKNNTVKECKYNMIHLTENHIENKNSKIISLSDMINRWVRLEFLDKNLSFKFESIPYMLPIYIDISQSSQSPESASLQRNIDIMEGIQFIDNGDKIQRMFIWEIHSLICQNYKGEYYVLVIDHNNDVIEFSDKQIPSNWKVDLSDHSIVDRIMKEIKFAFYKLQ